MNNSNIEKKRMKNLFFPFDKLFTNIKHNPSPAFHFIKYYLKVYPHWIMN